MHLRGFVRDSIQPMFSFFMQFFLILASLLLSFSALCVCDRRLTLTVFRECWAGSLGSKCPLFPLCLFFPSVLFDEFVEAGSYFGVCVVTVYFSFSNGRGY